MKKRLIVLLILICIPCLVNAQKCIVTSGTGKEIGNEITCGTESFYVLKTENNTTRMLAKYNLLVGDKIDYFDLEKPKTYDASIKEEELNKECNTLAKEKGYNPYHVYAKREALDNSKIKVLGCRVYERINANHTRQDERAVGTKLVDGKSVLPLYGITYMVPSWGYEAMHDGKKYENDYDKDGNLVLKGSPFKVYLDDYKKELVSQKVEVKDVSFITLEGVLDLLKDISGKEVKVKLEYPNIKEPLDKPLENPEEAYIGKMDVKKYAGDFNWLYDSTYWLGSGFKQKSLTEFNDYYMSNEGFLCALGRGECLYLPYPIGNGVRPVITINNNNIKYPIDKKSITILTCSIIIICSILSYFLLKNNSKTKNKK